MSTSPEFLRTLKSDSVTPVVHKYFPAERYITRPLAHLVVRAVARTSITPNQITTASFGCCIAAGLSFAAARPGFVALGGAFMQLASILDCADGQLARLKNQCSRYGAFLDLVLDRIGDFIALAGITVACFRIHGPAWPVVASAAAMGLYFLQVTLFYLFSLYRADGKTGQAAEARGLGIVILFAASLVGRLDLFVLALAGLGLYNIPTKTAAFIRRGRRSADLTAA